MKLKDMTENIKTRSAEQLSDENLENVSGGGGAYNFRCKVVCKNLLSEGCGFSSSFTNKRQAEYFISKCNGRCQQCGEGRLVLEQIT